MPNRPLRFAVVCSWLSLFASTAMAGPGDVIVPAHRSSNGTLIPANVPPSSGGTTMPLVRSGKSPSRAALRPVGRPRTTAVPVPMFQNASPIRQ